MKGKIIAFPIKGCTLSNQSYGHDVPMLYSFVQNIVKESIQNNPWTWLILQHHIFFMYFHAYVRLG